MNKLNNKMGFWEFADRNPELIFFGLIIVAGIVAGTLIAIFS